MFTTEFIARFLTKTSVGWGRYETENEMYVELECDGKVEENPNVIGIDYYEIHRYEDGKSEVIRRWDFGKPYLTDYWRTCVKVA